MLKAIVRVNIGKHDKYRKDQFANPDWDSITFTDLSAPEYREWSGDRETEVVTINDYMFPVKNLTDKKKSSFLGITALGTLREVTSVDYDLVMWVAGDACVTGNLNDFVNTVHKGNVSAPTHPDCENASEDAVKVINYNKDTYANVTATLKNFSDAGFFQKNGYHETNAMIKSNTAYARELERVWSTEYLWSATERDQMVLPFSRWILAEEQDLDNRFNSFSKKELNGYFL